MTLPRVGWVSQPNTRGTIDILWSCLVTIFVCIWSMLHLNVPAPTDTWRTLFSRRFRWCVMGILAPEVPMLMAAGQWASAKRSVQAMNNPGWTLVHAFYADSGGFIIHARDCKPFPATAKQIKYLVDREMIPLPTITREEIWDKGKADHFVKCVAFLQTMWMAAQIFSRLVQHLPVTPLELATVATALCSLTTLCFWWAKPLDVKVPTPIIVNAPLVEQAETIVDAKTEKPNTATTAVTTELECPQENTTPLDFVEPEIYMSRKWSKRLFRLIVKLGLQRPELDRVPNDRDPQLLNLTQHVVLGLACATFASLHFVNWNFAFDSYGELLLWRINCLIVTALLGTYGSVEVVACYRENHEKLGLDTMGAYKRRWPACLFFFVPAVLYFIGRVFVIFETFYSLRSLPEAAYVCVNWSAFIPHF